MTEGTPDAVHPEGGITPALAAELLSLAGIDCDRSRLRLSDVRGGVSADVCLIEHAGQHFCAKRPRPRLAVEGEWFADPERVRNEIAWHRTARELVPGLTPRLLAEHPDVPAFLMAWYPPTEWANWKERLMSGRAEAWVAETLGNAMGNLHRRGMGDAELARRFADDHFFETLRLMPFFDTTASRHQDLADVIEALRREVSGQRLTLVHGDLSPKNVLVGPGQRVILLDAECAVWGDPAFDAAFMISHLLLKAAWQPVRCADCPMLAMHFMDAWLDAAAVDAATRERAQRLVPLLLLARVDGLSPVEYLDPAQQGRVRSFARGQLRQGLVELPRLVQRWLRATAGEDR